MSSTTFITALFDISRESKGDGRSFSKYLEWSARTCLLGANLVVFTTPSLAQHFKDCRARADPLHKYKFEVRELALQSIPFYSKLPQITQILNSGSYKERVLDPQRIECKLPLYSVVTFAKFDFLRRIAVDNPFASDNFFWIDAGASRFFTDHELSRHFSLASHLPGGKFFLQGTESYTSYNVDQHGLWDNTSVVYAGMFGGGAGAVYRTTSLAISKFHEMLTAGIVNNEQIVLQNLAKTEKDIHVIPTNTGFKMLALVHGGGYKSSQFTPVFTHIIVDDKHTLPRRSDKTKHGKRSKISHLTIAMIFLALSVSMVACVVALTIPKKHK